MGRLNNKGMTTVEVLVCFVLLVIVVVSMYSSISNYSTKRELESARNQIVTYKNTLTKDIMDDITTRGLASVARTNPNISWDQPDSISGTNNEKAEYIIRLTFKSGTPAYKELKVTRQLACYDTTNTSCSDDSDVFQITYGDMDYPFPDVGKYEYESGKFVNDLRISDVAMKSDDNVLSIHIALQYKDFGNRYAINIIAPYGD